MARILVAGWVAQFPTAPFLWHAISFALGFRRLGHDVWFLEDSGDDPWGWDTAARREDPALRAGAEFLRRELAAIGLGDRWLLRHVPTNRWDGLPADVARDVIAQADVFVNVSMTTPMRPEYLAVPLRLAIDTDPVFTQVRIAHGDAVLGRVPETHTRLFSFGRPPLPGEQHEWLPTRQPVAADLWPVTPLPPVESGFSTVLAWQSYRPVMWEGRVYAAKDRSFELMRDLPAMVGVPLRLALGGAGATPEVRDRLRREGWRVEDAVEATVSTTAYRSFLASSLGEFGIAKHGYAVSRSAWFSERTCCYLASGRPAVVQQTGWTDWLPEGEGLFAFSTAADAARAVEEVLSDPERHAAAARRLVEEHFDAADVCGALLDGV